MVMMDFDTVDLKKVNNAPTQIGQSSELIPECKLVGTILSCINGVAKTGNPFISITVNTSKGMFETSLYLGTYATNKNTQENIANFLSCVEHGKDLNDLLKLAVKANDFTEFEGKQVIVSIVQDSWFKVDDNKDLILTEIELDRLVTTKKELTPNKILINDKTLEWVNKQIEDYSPKPEFLPELNFKNKINFKGFGVYKGQEDIFFGDCARKKLWDSFETSTLIGEDSIPF